MRLLAPRLGLLLVFPLLTSCAPRTGHVTGKVTYKGKPIPAGWLQFRPADPSQNSVPAGLDEDGNFAVDLPAGEVTVTIDNREWEPKPAISGGLPPNIPLSPEVRAKLGAAAKGAPAGGGEENRAGGTPRPGKYAPIPAKYYEASTSDLKFTVKGGSQTQNFELTD